MIKKILFIALFSFILITPCFSASASDVGINLTVTSETPTPPVAPVTPGGGGPLPGEKIPPKIFSLLIMEIDTVSAKISWETDESAVCTLFWGLSNDYEKASLGETSFLEKHLTVLKNLFPGHLYHFKIKCFDLARNTAETEDQIFYTLSMPDSVPPPNVSNFKAAPGIEKIVLSWENPASFDFKGVRILKKTDFYSANPRDGVVVYEEENVLNFGNYTDIGLKAGIKQYYTLYAFDESRNYSSGALASAVPLKKTETKIPLPPVPPAPAPSGASVAPIVPITPTQIPVLDISKDLEFYQDHKKIIPVDGKLTIDSGKELEVLILENKIPDFAKTVIIKVGTGAEASYYLLNKTKDGKYSAVIMLSKEGKVKITAEAIGQNDKVLSRGEKSLTVKKAAQGKKAFLQYWGYWILLAWFCLLILLLAVLFLSKRKKEKRGQ